MLSCVCVPVRCVFIALGDNSRGETRERGSAAKSKSLRLWVCVCEGLN